MLLGFLREIVNAKYYGTQWQLDTFLAASVVPTILFAILNYALISALIPVFSEYLVQGRRDEAWRLGSTVVNLLAIIMVGCAFLGYMLAPWYVPLIAHGFPEAQMRVAISMTRWLMPSVIAVALAGVLTGILNANRRFRAAAMVGVALNLVTIGVVVALNHKLGIFALVAGTACGLTAQFLVQIPAFLALRGYRFIIDIHHPGLKSMLALLGPIAVGSAAAQLGLFFDRFFASMLPPGSMAGMNYASKLVSFPQQIFASAIATVIFPLVAQQFAQANRESVARNTIYGTAPRQLHYDSVRVPAHCSGAPYCSDAFSAWELRSQLRKPDGWAAAVCGSRPHRHGRQLGTHPLSFCVSPNEVAGRGFHRQRRAQCHSVDCMATNAWRARSIAREFREPERFRCCCFSR